MTPEQSDSLRRVEVASAICIGELQTALEKIDELRNALACEMDDTRNACADLNREIDRLRSRLGEAEALLLEMKDYIDEGMETKFYRALIARIDAFLGDKP